MNAELTRSSRKCAKLLGTALTLATACLLLTSAAQGQAVSSQSGDRKLTPAQLASLQHKHPGVPGALDPENLHKKRPKPPFDMTGTWFVDLSQGFNKFKFGPPYPEFLAPGQQAMKDAAEAQKAGKTYRDSIGQCYPAGLPMIMTRVWPIMFVQEPTVIYMVAGFTNSFRAIYLDGRKPTDPDILVPTYNGESIGHWEGDTLVVTTTGFNTDNHWIDAGLPVSEDFKVVERIKMINHGNTLEIEYIMTDPQNWKGEWHNTKHWDRTLESDIGEVECNATQLNANLPGTDKGQEVIKEKEDKK